jgi:CheY-like chemotaxis protein
LSQLQSINSLPRILVVDDNPINIIVVKKYIEDVCVPDIVNNGPRALEMLGLHQYSLVFMDINLGDDDFTGVHVVQQLRANPTWRQLPVVAITAYVAEDARKRFIDQGFTEILSKPINREQLLQVIAKYTAQ